MVGAVAGLRPRGRKPAAAEPLVLRQLERPQGQADASPETQIGLLVPGYAQHRVKSPLHAVQGQLVQPAAAPYWTQWPLAHTSSVAHAFVHDPQCSGSVSSFTHALLQAVYGAVQLATHIPFSQTCPVQTFPPQSIGLLFGSMHAPPFRTSPGLHVQLEPEHHSPPPHCMLQLPQRFGSDVVSAQKEPQHVDPAAQGEQVVALHPNIGSLTSTQLPPHVFMPAPQPEPVVVPAPVEVPDPLAVVDVALAPPVDAK